MINDITDRIESFLNGEMKFMVHRLNMFRYHSRRQQIRTVFQSDGERMQKRPPGRNVITVILHTRSAQSGSDSGDHRGVQTTGEEHTVTAARGKKACKSER